MPRVWDLNDLHSDIEESIVRVFPGGQHPEVTGQSNGQNYAPGFVLSPDGRWLANIGESNGQLFDLSGVIPTPIILNSNMVSLAFSPDSQRLFSGSRDHTVKTWDLTPLLALSPAQPPPR